MHDARQAERVVSWLFPSKATEDVGVQDDFVVLRESGVPAVGLGAPGAVSPFRRPAWRRFWPALATRFLFSPHGALHACLQVGRRHEFASEGRIRADIVERDAALSEDDVHLRAAGGRQLLQRAVDHFPDLALGVTVEA